MIRTSYPLNRILTAIARRHETKERLTDDDLRARFAVGSVMFSIIPQIPAPGRRTRRRYFFILTGP